MKESKIGRKFAVSLVVVTLLAMALPLGTLGGQALAQEPITWYVDDDLSDYPSADFTKIQDAVNAASAGDAIIVYSGTSTEHVDVNKDRLIVGSESGAEVATVQAAYSCVAQRGQFAIARTRAVECAMST